MTAIETLDYLTSLIVAAKRDITDNYQSWWEIAMSIADSCGVAGRDDFMTISSFYPNFSREENEKLFTQVLNSSRGNHSLGTLVWHMKMAGIVIPKGKNGELNLTSYTNNSYSHTQEKKFGRNHDESLSDNENTSQSINLAEGLPCFPLDGWTKSISMALEFTDTQEKGNAMVLAYETIFGGMVNKRTSFVYSYQKWSPCLQYQLTGDSATGKDLLKNASQLLKSLQDKAYAKYCKAQEEFEMAKALWDSAGKKKAEIPMPRPPKKKFPMFTPDTTGPDLTRSIIESDGITTIVSPETDSWTKSVKQKDWGVNSATERILFEHGKLALSRATNREYMECPETFVTLAISGTPAQLHSLIPSTENGQFSRKVFYVLPTVEQYKSQFFGTTTSQPVFAKWGERWEYILNEVFKIVGHINFSLTKEQVNEFVSHMEAQFNRIKALGEKDLEASVLRMSITALRLMNILSILRSLDELFVAEKAPIITIDTLLQCPGLSIASTTCDDNRKDGIIPTLDLAISDADFHLNLQVADVLLAHTARVARLLPTSEYSYRKPTQSEMFWESLPGQFARKEAKAKAKEFGMTAGALDVALTRKVKEGTLKRKGKGIYIFTHVRETKKGKRKM